MIAFLASWVASDLCRVFLLGCGFRHGLEMRKRISVDRFPILAAQLFGRMQSLAHFRRNIRRLAQNFLGVHHLVERHDGLGKLAAQLCIFTLCRRHEMNGSDDPSIRDLLRSFAGAEKADQVRSE